MEKELLHLLIKKKITKGKKSLLIAIKHSDDNHISFIAINFINKDLYNIQITIFIIINDLKDI